MNPRAAINDLHPFQGCPFGLLGTSPSKLIQSTCIYLYGIPKIIQSDFRSETIANGEGGIRTHAPLRTNGFQDRLVMTTSIPLHLFSIVQNNGLFFCVPQQCKSYYSEKAPQCQHIFSIIFNYFFERGIFPVFTAYEGQGHSLIFTKSDSFFQNAVCNQ